MRYRTRYVHKISPSEKDVGPSVDLSIADLDNRKTLGAALRRQHVMSAGDQISNFRIEQSGRVVVFPKASIWHSIVLEA